MVGGQVPVALKKIAIDCAVVLALGSLFTFFTVYDSGKLPFAERFLFWGSTIGAGWLLAAVVRPHVHRLFAEHSVAIQLIMLGVIVSLPIPLILFWFDTGFQQTWPIWNWGRQYFLTFVIVILILTGHYITLKSIGTTDDLTASDGANDTQAAGVFLNRLPVEFHNATLYAVSSEDHYLRVHTDRGDALILMRLADAMRELEVVDGLQTHRSWWVAREGIMQMTGKSDKQSLTLKSGAIVPIARSRAKIARETLNLWEF